MKARLTLSVSTAVALALSATNVNAAQITESQVVEHYANVAHAVFEDSLISAKKLNNSIENFLANPTQETFAQAKVDWLAARVPYQQSEVFRFGNAIVDDWEGQLNAWPLDEGLIDYVAKDYQHELGNEGASANIIANTSLTIGAATVDAKEITPELIASLNEVGGSEANVASGYHAIEFLLWGQDLNGTNAGAGNRSYTDYLNGDQCTNGNCERRGDYLQATAQLLVQDLEWMEQQWSAQQSDNYRQTLLAESAENGLRKMLFGMGSLSLGELAGERMKVALEANSTEDEHDCFSDNTHNSHFYNAQGVYNVFTGEYARINGEVVSGPSIKDLVEQKNDTEAVAIQGEFDNTLKQVHALVDSAEKNNVYFDQLIAANNSEGHKIVNSAISALVMQTAAIEKAAGILAIDNLNPDTADHEF
ncbi:imelysin family protein [Vibrio sp. RC27]